MFTMRYNPIRYLLISGSQVRVLYRPFTLPNAILRSRNQAFAYKHVYIRNDEELVCADLTLQKSDTAGQRAK